MEKMMALEWYVALLIVAIGVLQPSVAAPTDGFVEQKYSYVVQKPYNVSVDKRFSIKNGVYTMWVFDDDKPHTTTNPTKPRTEMRFSVNYESGVWQFEGDMYVPSGTTGVAVMQVMGSASGGSAAPQIRVYNGELLQYGSQADHQFGPSDVYDKWIHLNVIHDADKKHIQVFLDGKLSLDAPNPGRGSHYFKCGVYTQNNASHRMESRWKNIKIWKRA